MSAQSIPKTDKKEKKKWSFVRRELKSSFDLHHKESFVVYSILTCVGNLMIF